MEMEKKAMKKDESNSNLEPSEIEIVLRRFASAEKNRPLQDLLDKIYKPAEDMMKHETSSKDPAEDSKEH
jgi:hypothetical protein